MRSNKQTASTGHSISARISAETVCKKISACWLCAGNEKSTQVDGFLQNDDYAALNQLTASLLQSDEAQSELSRLVLFFDEAYSCVDKSL